jgi:uncharacterized protein (TIRG00374 family)
MSVELDEHDVDPAPAVAERAPDGRTLLIRMAVGLGIGVVFVVVFVQLVNIRSVLRRVEHLNAGYAVLCGAVFLSAYVVRALRWRTFLAPDDVSRSRVIGIYFIAIFLNWLLPVQGGELAKSAILRRTNDIPVSRSLATVMMDKTMDLLPAAILLVVVPFAGLHLSRALWVFLLFPLFVLGACVLGLVATSKWGLHRRALVSRVLGAVLPRHFAERAAGFVMQFVDTLVALFRRPRLLATAAAYTLVAVTLDALFCYLAFLAVGTSLSLAVVLYGYTLYNLAYIFPTPPGHLGSNELIGLLVFSGVFGVSRSGVGAMFLFSHPFTAILMTTAALVSLRAIGLDLRSTLRLPTRVETTGAS